MLHVLILTRSHTRSEGGNLAIREFIRFDIYFTLYFILQVYLHVEFSSLSCHTIAPSERGGVSELVSGVT